MSLLITDLKLPLDADERALYTAVAKTLSLSIETINNIRVVRLALDARKTVSYTHLDVYKRQGENSSLSQHDNPRFRY